MNNGYINHVWLTGARALPTLWRVTDDRLSVAPIRPLAPPQFSSYSLATGRAVYRQLSNLAKRGGRRLFAAGEKIAAGRNNTAKCWREPVVALSQRDKLPVQVAAQCIFEPKWHTRGAVS